MQKFKVALDAGHGGKDSGAVGHGAKEKDIALSIAQKTNKLLQEKGISALMTRNDDTFVELSDRTEMANSWGADIFISIHLNAFTNDNARGYEDFSYSGNSMLQRITHKHLAPFWSVDRGLKSASYWVLRKTYMPAILIECGFISTSDNKNMIDDDSEQQEIAQRLANAIIEYKEVMFDA